jgi:hypothetical protein
VPKPTNVGEHGRAAHVSVFTAKNKLASLQAKIDKKVGVRLSSKYMPSQIDM